MANIILDEINENIKNYNELTEAWLKGSDWLSEKGRTKSELERGGKRLQEVLKDLNDVYMYLKERGIKVFPEKLLETK